MAQRLNLLEKSVEWRLLQKGQRLFALLGKATPTGMAPFGPEYVRRSWAVTAEFGCIRLERLTGDEEVTGLELFLPTPLTYDYGISGVSGAPELTRAIFGLLPSEMEELVNALRKGSFPVLGFSLRDLKCSISSTIIPACWPHLVVSNLALYGNVVSVETFIKILVSSLPHGHLGIRFPFLQQVAKEILSLMGAQRPGFPYCKEMIALAPAEALAAK